MNQIYVILGAPFWRAFGKRIGLWYAHGSTPFSLKIAEKMTDRVFTSTPEGFRLPSKKICIVGQGIDTALFKPVEQKTSSEKKRLITVGRISPSKNIATLIEACEILKSKNISFDFKIIGNTQTEGDAQYEKQLKGLIIKKELKNEVFWIGGVSNFELPQYLQQADIFIHDGATNSLDKALLEASLCGCVVISSNPAYISETKAIAPEYLYKQGDSVQLARIVEIVDEISDTKNIVREYFLNRYTVSNLISGILGKY
jgi:glycosyltransferase involved in cell wall biosynthesis